MEIFPTELIQGATELGLVQNKTDTARPREDSASVGAEKGTEASEATRIDPGAYAPSSQPIATESVPTEDRVDPLFLERDPAEDKPDEDKTIQEKEVEASEQQRTLSNSVIQFQIEEVEDPETGTVSKKLVVFLLDQESGEVIRRIPPEDFLSQASGPPRPGMMLDQLA